LRGSSTGRSGSRFSGQTADDGAIRRPPTSSATTSAETDATAIEQVIVTGPGESFAEAPGSSVRVEVEILRGLNFPY
jgi:hypothetical protein